MRSESQLRLGDMVPVWLFDGQVHLQILRPRQNFGVFHDVVPDIKIASPPVSSFDKSDSTSTMFQAIDALFLSWVCVDDVTGSMLSWHTTDAPQPLIWNISHVFTTEAKSILFRRLHPSASLSILPLHQLRSTSDTLFHSDRGLDITFIPHCNGKVVEWARELSSPRAE